jgi:hypothetical protein
MAYREVTMIEITEVLRQWLTGDSWQQCVAGSRDATRVFFWRPSWYRPR